MKFKNIYIAACLLLVLFSCKSKDSAAGGEDAAVASQTPVTVTTVTDSSMTDYADLSATSIFLQKNFVKANANGYIQNVNTQLGHFVNKGATIFTIKTKEAQSIGNSINILDTTFRFSGVNRIKAPGNGYITQLAHQQGDYVADGEQLAVISDRSSFVFVMQLPYEMRQYVQNNQNVQLILPGGEKLTGTVASSMPSVDTLSQTQGIVIKASSNNPIPENLVAKARIIRSSRPHTASLPKSAVLTNETQTEFWVMKLINPTTAVKTPITKGLETGDRVEILSPKFNPKDMIVVTGNYGLTDTAKVKIVQ
ncbi:HlyD family secretion protein [Mucilaginibacter pineti]|uniref:HlyD family secretion protein n=1 Tax=Mucilaginibacter pineti TaxID=1391627 RepID=A0A1G7J6Q9_9SPHI|nr:HlyD family efflux transporter periplasmic adaptor subunit [Mucilaginibacter pineti]SDF20555.1 HlyD family secretion protein [Mucilaginibacter pineti]